MQAALAPLMAVAGGAAPLALGVQAASGIASGLSAYSAGKAQAQGAKINAYIGQTRANQTNATAREGMESELGAMRAALAANKQRQTVGTGEVFRELRRVRERDRRIEFSNRMQEASAYRMQAQAYDQGAKQGLVSGFFKAAPSIFHLADWRMKNGY